MFTRANTTDPPVSKDLRCAQCGKPLGRTVPKAATARARAALTAMLKADPFCSAACARLWHRVDVHEEPQKANPDDLDWTT